MNLQELLEITAGGKGSGCSGPNCGRPKGHKGEHGTKGETYHGTSAVFVNSIMKNGLTGGFTSKIILDRANHRAVVVLSNTAAEVDTAANSLLVGEHAWIPSR